MTVSLFNMTDPSYSLQQLYFVIKYCSTSISFLPTRYLYVCGGTSVKYTRSPGPEDILHTHTTQSAAPVGQKNAQHDVMV